MALRSIVTKGDPILGKKCRTVDVIDEKIITLLEDMRETMIAGNGVGIAAPQVGMLKRICICMPDPENSDEIIELINPEILEAEGEQEGYEGCLSVPDMVGAVIRPQRIKVKALDRSGTENTYDFSGFAAVVASHEIDHLDGILYVDKARDVHNPQEDEKESTAKGGNR